jgi:hypothetical protein
MGEMKIYTEFYTENMKARDQLGDISIDEIILLKWILKEKIVKVWIELLAVIGSCEHGNEYSGSNC